MSVQWGCRQLYIECLAAALLVAFAAACGSLNQGHVGGVVALGSGSGSGFRFGVYGLDDQDRNQSQPICVCLLSV